MGKPNVWLYGVQTLAPIFGALIVYGCSYIDGKGNLSGWQWGKSGFTLPSSDSTNQGISVYLLEGIFTILFSFVVYFVLPDYPKSPRSSKWLTPREQEYLDVRLSENQPRTHESKFDIKEVWASLRNPRTYAFTTAQLFMNFGGYALTWQTPIIITNLNFVGLPRNVLLLLPIAASCIIGVIFAGWFQKKAYITRPLFTMYICAIMLAFFIMLAVVNGRIAIYMSIMFGLTFYLMYFVPFWSCKLPHPLPFLPFPH